MVLAHYLTKRIIEPIEKMAEDLDNIENYVPYPELAPFAHAVQTAQEQKKANEEQRRDLRPMSSRVENSVNEYHGL